MAHECKRNLIDMFYLTIELLKSNYIKQYIYMLLIAVGFNTRNPAKEFRE